MTIQEAIKNGCVEEALLGKGECFVQSRYLPGHDYLLALYWLNKAVQQKGNSAESVACIEKAFGVLVDGHRYEEAANFISALDAAMREKKWTIPVDFPAFARKFKPCIDHVSLSNEFRDTLKTQAEVFPKG